ncbi:hypothetical protein B0H16DRAFT_323389 [Mycena metata]|uniref:Uncharacterized protein n=1 Tax=Mycena metata TaxID=1033252 RepID=A0AAD7MN59_9AGAR|nr:hypothetical protein B0H16DRAFT_323389 [Mycena metata]
MTPPHPFLPTDLASSFTASLSAGPHSSWHCITHLRAAFFKRTVDLNVGRAKLGTFTAAYMRALTFIHPGRSYARRRRHSWRAAADDPTLRGHDGADGGRVHEHWLANVVEELYFPSFPLKSLRNFPEDLDVSRVSLERPPLRFPTRLQQLAPRSVGHDGTDGAHGDVLRRKDADMVELYSQRLHRRRVPPSFQSHRRF